jgi:Flp pilus assembly pilin Flp
MQPTVTERPPLSPAPSCARSRAAAGGGDARRVPVLVRDERGVATVEYVTVLIFVSLVGAAAIVGLGVPLIQLFRYVQMVIAMPVP